MATASYSCSSSAILFFFIYLLTLFNVDYKTLAAYALIKIDYPPQKKAQ